MSKDLVSLFRPDPDGSAAISAVAAWAESIAVWAFDLYRFLAEEDRARQSLSQAAITQAVKADHTYAKVFGTDSPDLRLTATYPSGPTAIIGDSLQGPVAKLTARVLGAGPTAPRPGPWEARILRNGEPVETATVDSADFTFTFETT